MAVDNSAIHSGRQSEIVGIDNEAAQAASLAKGDRYPRCSRTPRKTANRQSKLLATMLSMNAASLPSCRYATLSYAKAEKVVNAPQNPVAINNRQ
jgi:hypothetical protein